MTKLLTSLELYVVVQELKGLQGCKVNKIYQPDSHSLVIHFFRTGGHNYVLKIDSGIGLHLTTYSLEYPQIPPTFCMFLRKYLNSSELVDVNQKDLERIVEFSFATREGKLILICELFSKGNFILTNDKYEILNSAAVQIWKHRKIKRGETYTYPPKSGNDLFETAKNLKAYLEASKNYPLVNVLATLGFGSLYAEELCARTGIKKDKQVSMLTKEEEEKLARETSSLVDSLISMKLSPKVYYQNEQVFEATPVEMKSLSSLKSMQIGTFNEALDVLYMTKKTLDIKAEKDTELKVQRERVERIVETQEKSIDEYHEIYEKNKKLGDLIYENYGTISKILRILKDARDAGQSWYDIYNIVENEKDQSIPEAKLIKKLYPEDDTVLLNIGEGLRLNLKKSLEENAEDYYDKAKKAKAKIDGAQEAVDKSKQELTSMELKKAKIYKELEARAPKPKEVEQKEWYEKFRWFFTSSGLLAIGGRDATQNEIVIKKYLEIKDLVFHTEMPGSPFFILKEGRDKATQQDLQEVAVATASYSRAWKLGVGAAAVLCVRAEQVSKDAPSGTYMAKGSFMVTGKRTYFRNSELKVAIGITKDGKVIGGPADAVRKYSTKMIQLRQGQVSKTDTAKKIAHDFNVDLDKVISFLPSGDFQIC